jgi:signal transduction histidine kinase
MRSWCREFGNQRQIQIDFRGQELPEPPSPEVSLCLFRVLQEALNNAAKHSRAEYVGVELWGAADEIHLTVSDFGAGFDAEEAMKCQGLGLLSMKERLRLVDGELSITSHPSQGTTVHARVSLTSKNDSAQAAG